MKGNVMIPRDANGNLLPVDLYVVVASEDFQEVYRSQWHTVDDAIDDAVTTALEYGFGSDNVDEIASDVTKWHGAFMDDVNIYVRKL